MAEETPPSLLESMVSKNRCVRNDYVAIFSDSHISWQYLRIILNNFWWGFCYVYLKARHLILDSDELHEKRIYTWRIASFTNYRGLRSLRIFCTELRIGPILRPHSNSSAALRIVQAVHVVPTHFSLLFQKKRKSSFTNILRVNDSAHPIKFRFVGLLSDTQQS